ncbi:MAG: hypothetical protein IT181_17300 [Acidobacteria bacterium]|nr:hypothetical protein [Acidobacteriota bacterium]
MLRFGLIRAVATVGLCAALWAAAIEARAPQLIIGGVVGGSGTSTFACELGRSAIGTNLDGSTICSTVTTAIGPTKEDGWVHYYNMTSGPSIVVGADGRPVVVYAGAFGKNVLRCGNRSCLSGNTQAAAESDAADVVTPDYYPSALLDASGHPTFARVHLYSGALEFIHCLSVTCTAATTKRTIRYDDSATYTYLFPSLARGPNGLPIIAYQAFYEWASSTVSSELRPPNRLILTYCDDTACSSMRHYTMTVVGDQGYAADLKIGVDGAPLIVHGTDAGLKVTHCQSPGCFTSGVLPPESVLLTGPFALAPHENDAWRFAPALAIGADKLPIISYRAPNRAHRGMLRVTHCGSADCKTGNTTVDITAPTGPGGALAPQLGRHTSIAIGADGLPVIAHDDEVTGSLKVTHCATVTCVGHTTTAVVDSAPGTAAPAVAIGTDGTPVIAYISDDPAGSSGQILKIAKCARLTCVG